MEFSITTRIANHYNKQSLTMVAVVEWPLMTQSERFLFVCLFFISSVFANYSLLNHAGRTLTVIHNYRHH